MRILRAAWVAPISAAPIENGEVLIDGDRIVALRPTTAASGAEVDDFGDAILLPGLVNVHTHLDYTVMRGLLEDLDFFPWIRELTARAQALSQDDWSASAAWGAAEAVAGGVTAIGDCTFSGAAYKAAQDFGLGGSIYREVFGIDELRQVGEIVAELRGRVEEMTSPGSHAARIYSGYGTGAEARSIVGEVSGATTRSAGGLTPTTPRPMPVSSSPRLRAGISPHAPYTVRPALFRALAEYANQENLPVCIHAAESQAEGELLRSGTGAFAEMYLRRGISWQAPAGSAVAYLDSLGILSPRTLLVHGVQMSASDRAIVRARDVAWAHCPKSNAKLGVGVAPLGLLRDSGDEPPGLTPDDLADAQGKGVRIGLGSDSVASNNTMDMFEEMRFAVLMQRAARRRIAAFGARQAVEMATIGGARALGLQSEIGTLEPGKRADLCVVRLGELHSAPAYHPYSALVYAARASDVVCTYLAGEARYDARLGPRLEDRFPVNDLAPIREQLHEAARKMREWRPTS